MTDNLDSLLAQLAAAPPPARLVGISDLVISRLHADAADTRTVMRVGAVAAVSALAFGLMGSLAVPASAPAAPLAPFGVSSALAPSTLLDGGR